MQQIKTSLSFGTRFRRFVSVRVTFVSQDENKYYYDVKEIRKMIN
jgi:hypothetical protein